VTPGEAGYVPLSPDTARACEEVITGPGVPCDHTIPLPSLDAVRAFLAATGWTEGEPGRYGALWTRGKVQLGVPREQEPFTHRGLVDRIAAIEGCTLAAVARQITAAHEPAGVSIVRKRAGAPQQAMQYTGANLAEVMGWITETGETPFLSEEDRYLLIGTPSDYTGAAPGEWLIRSPGTRFGFGHDLADADEFAAAYEPADAPGAHDDRDEEIARLRSAQAAAGAELAALRTELGHAKSALAGDNEGVRLWMLDCGEMVTQHRKRAERAEAKLARSEEGEPFDREQLGRMVREIWVAAAREHPDPKPSWLVPWDELGEWDKEVDRRIGEAVASHAALVTAIETHQVGSRERAGLIRQRDLAMTEAAKLREKLASYDSAISWATSCTACARTLDGSIADHDRAEAAEAKLAALTELCKDPFRAEDVMAIIDGEADPRA
jgi:hypothetical protein